MPSITGAPPIRGVLELDRFSEESVERWNQLSIDLNELYDVLHFNLEPERRRRRADLIAAIKRAPATSYTLDNWVRIVSYKFSDQPLSSAGSLKSVGGRFNPGVDLEPHTMNPWSALYIAQDHATAYREKFQLHRDEKVDGLTPEELSLQTGGSYTAFLVRGTLSRVFDMTSPASLAPLATILARIKMPVRAERLKRKLKIKPDALRMVRTPKQIFEAATLHNWRVLPVQFGLPAHSQILAEMIRASGFEAISYPSSKGGKTCLAIFPDRLAAGSFIELVDEAPKSVQHRRLDVTSADDLSA